ncbi:MAG: acyl carrier protein [Bdellovibrionota bacterium]
MNEQNYQTLKKILARKSLVAESEIHPDTDLFLDLDIDSLCLIEAFMEIQKEFQVTLHPAALARETFNTPKKLLALISQS